MILDNSALDARPFSLTGQNTLKPAYNRITGTVTLGGPLRIPRLLNNGPIFFIGYQWTRNSNSSIASALVPDLNERNGILPGHVIAQSRISPQSRALLSFYPFPNFDGNAR